MTENRPRVDDEEALDFHRNPKPGKIALRATKPMATQRDLVLAYSPGVAAPVKAIAEISTRPMTTRPRAISLR
jgi:malate dehydrogenase (oxaloacetate-decarboxylating)(NADP+)